MSAFGFSITRDEITPSLQRLLSPAWQERILTSGATALAALAVRAFDEAGLRPAAWAPRKSRRGTHPLLILSGSLRQGIHSAGNQIRVPAKYGAAHQFGSEKTHLPARPFFPATDDGELTPVAVQHLDQVVMVLARSAAGTGA